jgi:hypothetical protein
MKGWTLIGFSLLAGFSFSSLSAIDHRILDEGRPLRLEDAYSIAHGEVALETGIGFISPRRGRSHAFFPVELLWGAFPNYHFELGTTFFTDPRDLEGPARSGDLHLGALYNFNQETLTVPALGIKGNVRLPTGSDSSGTDFELKGMMTKSFGRLSLHFNAAYEWLARSAPGEREGRWVAVFGPSYPVGAPRYTRTVILADIYIEQSHQRGERETVGVEVGFRHQLTERIVVDAGLGTEVRGPPDRAELIATTGISIGF